MRLIYALAVTLAALSCASASNEILAILDKATDLTTQEMTVLRLILQELQKQYDHIKNEIDKTPTPYANPIDNPKVTDADVDEYQAQIAALIHQEDVEEFPIQNDTKLPTIAEIVGESIDMDGLTEEQVNEVSDLLSLMQEELDETQHLIDDYMQRSKGIHANLLKINKPKIIIYIYEALGMIYGIAGRVGRAAYCTYYYGPQLNDSLTDIYDGIDCWQYTKSVVIRIETQAAQFLSNSKKTALALGDLYKRLTAKKSLLGRVLAVFLSIKKIKRSAEATYESAIKALDDLQNELPQAGTNALQCGLKFVGTLPHLQDVLQHLTACILFVEEKTEDYEFLKPEAERN